MKIGDAPVPVHEKMVKFLPTYYLELDKISPTENLSMKMISMIYEF